VQGYLTGRECLICAGPATGKPAEMMMKKLRLALFVSYASIG
jgi:hypothetical protein